MKKLVVLLLLLVFHIVVASAQEQIPNDIKRIMEKASSGKELTEQEDARLAVCAVGSISY